jgi:hypothetical protein
MEETLPDLTPIVAAGGKTNKPHGPAKLKRYRPPGETVPEAQDDTSAAELTTDERDTLAEYFRAKDREIALAMIPPPDLQVAFDDAFAAAQRAFTPILRSRTVEVFPKQRADGYKPPAYKFSYAPLETILAACVPALNDHAISFRQFVQIRLRGESWDHFVVTRLRYKGLVVDDDGIFVFKTDPNAQAYGAAVTYAKRMGATLAFGVAADDDNDGNHGGGDDFTVRDGAQRAQGSTRPQTPRQTREEGKRAVAEAAKEPATKLSTAPVKEYTERELADMEGKVVDYRDELIEALAEGRRTGIVQIWDEIKGNEFIGTRVWNAIRDGHPDLYRTLKDVVAPAENKGPRGPKPRNPDSPPLQGKLA